MRTPGWGATAAKRAAQRSGSRRVPSATCAMQRGSAGQRPLSRPAQARAGRWHAAVDGRGSGGRRWSGVWTGAWARPRGATGCAVAGIRSWPRAAPMAGGRRGARPSGQGRRRPSRAATGPRCSAPIAAVGRPGSGCGARPRTKAALRRPSSSRAGPLSHRLRWRRGRTAGPGAKRPCARPNQRWGGSTGGSTQGKRRRVACFEPVWRTLGCSGVNAG